MTFDGYMEYQVLPRLLALAERAWSPDPVWSTETGAKRTEHFNADWSSFANRLGKRELPRLDYYNGGYKYRIPTPSFLADNGKLLVNTEFPGFEIRYSTDGSEPGNSSRLYSSAIDNNQSIRLRAFSASGRGGATVVVR
jgi:hexosaminidase